MKRLLGVLLLMVTVSSWATPLPEVKVSKINDRIYALLGPEELPNKHNQGYMVNSALIIGDKEAVIVDTGFTHQIGLHLRKAAESITDKPITHVINTHHHGDHMLGNTAFPEAEIISSEKCREWVATRGQEALTLVEQMTGMTFPDTRPVPATRTYQTLTKTELTIGGVKMVMWVPKASHTVGDLMVYLPDDQVLVGGDILVNGVIPSLHDGFAESWVETLAEVEKTPIKTVIPGHGPLMNKEGVIHLHHMMAALYDAVDEGWKEGLTDSEIRTKTDLSEWEKLKRYDEMGGNINRIYMQVEEKNF